MWRSLPASPVENGHERRNVVNRQRRATIFLLCLAVLMTLISVLLIGLAVMQHQEMLHEGLTQSQWYENATRSYQKGRLWAGISAAITLIIWIAALLHIRKTKRAKQKNSPRR